MRQINLNILLLLFSFTCSAQEVYKHISHTDIYDYLDELANSKIIDLNSAIKPYSRNMIAEKLKEASQKLPELNKRQSDELNFYLKDYYKELSPGNETIWLFGKKLPAKRFDLFYYHDSLFSITVNPILGINYFKNDSGTFYHRWNGGEVHGYIGESFGYYASLRDNYESQRFSTPDYLNQSPGHDYKGNVYGGVDFDEMRGGISYSWKWGSLGVLKDQLEWGDNMHGANILSGRAPSFTHIRLHVHPVRWLDFNYIHGWLVSNLFDSSKVFYANGFLNRLVYRQKYLAANMVTVTPFRNFQVSLGNSIVYGDQINPAFLVPIFFYKSIDHDVASARSNLLGQNSQMFFNISSRNIKNIHLYTSWLIDEISFSNVFDPAKHSNIFTAKFGAHFSNFLLPNLFATAEYTRTNPITYRHYVLITNYESDDYNMGHYLGDNAEEIYLSLGYKPLAKLYVEASYTLAQKGPEYPYDPNVPNGTGHGNPFLTEAVWQAETIALKANYQIINDCYLFASFSNSDYKGVMVEKYTMPYFIGKQNTINVGANIGF